MKKITKIEVPERPVEQPLMVAAYARVSTDSDEQLISLDTQKTYYEKFIRSNPKWEYAGLYYDEGITGTKKDKRRGLLRLLQDCRKGKIDRIIVKSISRLARNTVDTLEIVRELADLGITIYFEKENIDTGSMNGELMLSILSGLAQSESASISANEKWSIQKRFEQGKFVIGFPPYGYKNENGQMVIIPEQAEIVRWIFEAYMSGKGSYAIANELNARGVPSKNGGKWVPSGVNGIIRNEKYTGDVLYQKTYTDSQFNRHHNDGEVTQYYVRDHHEAIISHELFDSAQELIVHNGAMYGNVRGSDKYQRRYPFSGKLICGECGSSFKRRTHKTVDGKYFAYSCNTHISDKRRCGMLYICEDQLQVAFINMMNKLICCHADVLRPYVEALKNSGKKIDTKRADELNTLLNENSDRQKNLLYLFSKGYLDGGMYQKMREELDAECDRLSLERDSILRSTDDDTDKLLAAEQLLHYCMAATPTEEFNEKLIERFMDHAVAESRDVIVFVMRCGLKLRERM